MLSLLDWCFPFFKSAFCVYTVKALNVLSLPLHWESLQAIFSVLSIPLHFDGLAILSVLCMPLHWEKLQLPQARLYSLTLQRCCKLES